MVLVVFFCFTCLEAYAKTVSKNDTSKKDAGTKDSSKNPEEYLLPPVKKKKPIPDPYEVDKLAPWAYFMIRFTAITVGSFPISILLGGVGFDTYKTINESHSAGKFQSKYLPLFFGGAGKPKYTSEEIGTLLFTAMSISLAVGVTDLIIGLVKHFRQQEINELFLPSTQ